MIMSIGQNIKKIREEKGLTQQSIAELIAMHRSNYSKIESGQRELSIDALHKISKFFGMTIDQIVTFEGNIPQEVTVEDKSLSEQIKLIQELDEEDKTIVFKMVDKMLTSKKFKEFFSKNVAAL
jgi:transcriptional regulator with XRE-family HTH domain